MGDRHYDSLEIRDPDDRERGFFGRLPDLAVGAWGARGGQRRLAGSNPSAAPRGAALARRRGRPKSDPGGRKRERPPFGGFNVAGTARLRRLLMSPGPIFEPQGASED